MKGYSTLPRSSELDSHNQMQFSSHTLEPACKLLIRACQKVMPSILLCWAMMLKVNVGVIAVEVAFIKKLSFH